MRLYPANSYYQCKRLSGNINAIFVELSCPRLKGDSRTANFIAKFAINIDIESLLRLVGWKYLIISYHWINYERESEEIITKTLKGLHFLKFLGLPKKKTICNFFGSLTRSSIDLSIFYIFFRQGKL